MSSETPDESTTEVLEETAENGVATDAAALEEDLLLREEANVKRWREDLDNQRAALGDAEEICVFLLDDLLVAIFQEMQARAENASLFALATRQACFQAFESFDMSACQPSDSLDHILGTAQDERAGRQQVLETQSKWSQNLHPRQSVESPSSAPSLYLSPPPLLFLRRLLHFLEKKADRADLELQRFALSEAVALLSGRRKLVGVAGTSGHSTWEWCISIEHMPAFLQELTSRGLVSALPSAMAFVLAANRESLDKKHHLLMHVTVLQLHHFVEKALLTAEEQEEEEKAHRNLLRQTSWPRVSDSKSTTDTKTTPRLRIFQTEVPLRAVPLGKDSHEGTTSGEELKEGPQKELLSSYLAESPPKAIEMDRRAPGQVSKKAALSAANPTRRALSRKVIMLMVPPPRQGSKWTSVRNKIIIPSPDDLKPGDTTITAEADMELHLAGDGRQQAGISSVPERKTTVAQVMGAGMIAQIEETPDAAALANIFSLGTPRQLSAQELARRNDVLAQLERDAARAQRRATTTVIASMNIGGPPPQDDSVRPSQSDQQQFQAYVAANSIVMTGLEYEGRPTALSPTRPEQGAQAPAPRRRERGGNIARSKFEVERDSLLFNVSDGNAHVREEQERLSAAVCSPIKRPRASVSLSSPPETPGRPIRTASTLAHLPQLDSSRLAVGVSAVVRGVEKRGPRRNPSRKSRLQLHNYSKAFEDGDDAATESNGNASLPLSPVRTAAPTKENSSRGFRLPLIPVVSPIKASPHRKHVAFKFNDDTNGDRAPRSGSPNVREQQQQSPTKAKQPVWESKTISPPRSRNRHFATGRHFRKIQRYADEEAEESASARRQKQEEHDLNIFRQPMAAPRRAVLPAHSELDDEI